MDVYIFGIIFILILLPILYFIPIGISLKEKVLIAIMSFVLAEIGLFLNQFLGIWKTLLILVLLAVIITYIVETRIRPRLTDKKGQRKALLKESEESSDLLISKEEPAVLKSDMDSESDGDYDLGQEAIDRLLSEMNKSKTEPVEEIQDASLDNIHKNDLNIEYEDFIEPVEDSFIKVENTVDEINVIQPANTSFETEADIAVFENENMLNVEELTQNQELEIDDLPEETEEDPLQLAKSIDADSEIDFEKLLEDHTSDGNDFEENNRYDDKLLLERSQLFEHLDELEGVDDKEDLDGIKHSDEVGEAQLMESVESLVDQFDEISSIDQQEADEPVKSIESMLGELDEIKPLEQLDESEPKSENYIESVFEELNEIELIDLEEVKSAESIEGVLVEPEEIEPIEQPDSEQLEDSVKNILEELEEIGPIDQIDDIQLEESAENVLEVPDEIEQTEQVNEGEPVQLIESILEELEEIAPIKQENLVQSEHLVEEILSEENEQEVIEENHKIMDDIEDITTSEDIQRGDTIVEEYVQEQQIDENTIKEISPARSEIQRQMLETMVSQINFSKSRLTDEEYEDLVYAHMQSSLPALEYYTFAYMLIEHYIAKGQFDKLTALINELYNKFDQYPVIKLQLEYLIEKYNNS